MEPGKKNHVWGVVMLILILLAGVFLWKFFTQSSGCTEEALMCPDGSSVGRQGLKCEFPECPDLQACDAATSCPDGMTCLAVRNANGYDLPETPFCVSEQVEACRTFCQKDTCLMQESYPPTLVC